MQMNLMYTLEARKKEAKEVECRRGVQKCLKQIALKVSDTEKVEYSHRAPEGVAEKEEERQEQKNCYTKKALQNL